MIPFVIISMALAAPIPKSTYEGIIALLISKPKKEILLLSPHGAELKRIDLSGVTGQPTLIKLAKANNGALIQTFELIDAKKHKFLNRTYLVDLKTATKPKLIFESNDSYTSTIDRDATFAYGSERESNNIQDGESSTYRHWRVELKTGKKINFDLPNNHEIKDIAHDEQTFLTAHWPDRQDRSTRAAIVTLETKAVKYVSVSSINPCVITSNGRVIITFGGRLEKIGGPAIYIIVSHNIHSNTKETIFETKNYDEIGAYAYGPKYQLALLQRIRDARTNNYQYALHVYSTDGKTKETIYKTKSELTIVDMEWR